MIDHLSQHTTHYEKSKALYDAVFAALGYSLWREMVSDWNPEFPTGRLAAYGPAGKPVFWLIEVKTPPTGTHFAFVAKDPAAVDAFYRAALVAGGRDNGAPGPRPHYHPDYYGAFVLDPDGHNIEAVCHTKNS